MNVRKKTKGKAKKKRSNGKQKPLVPEIVEAIPVTTLSNPPAVINVDVTAPVRKQKLFFNRPHTAETSVMAFEKYVELGDERAYHKVATAMGLPVATINRWAKTNKWQEKIKDLSNAAISSSVVESITEQMAKRKAHLRLVDFMLESAAVKDEHGNVIGSKVELKSMQDVQRALETRENILDVNKDKNKLFGDNAQIGKAVFIIRK